MDAALTEPTVERAGEGSPSLQLDGFSGPLDLLLSLARTQRIDLARLSVPDLVAQLAAALEQASGNITLGQKGGWVVMAAWLVWLRSRLLLPPDPADQAAEGEGGRLRDRLLALQQAQALAGWLEGRPQLGYDVFARGQPELPALRVDAGSTIANRHKVDVVEFLWAGLAPFRRHAQAYRDRALSAAVDGSVFRRRGARPHSACPVGSVGPDADAAPVAAGGRGRGGGAATAEPAAAAVRLGRHPDRLSRARQTGPGGHGAGRQLYADPGEPDPGRRAGRPQPPGCRWPEWIESRIGRGCCARKPTGTRDAADGKSPEPIRPPSSGWGRP